jgi:hypothetical protein
LKKNNSAINDFDNIYLKDIYHGDIYQNHIKAHHLGQIHQLSWSMAVDGVQ